MTAPPTMSTSKLDLPYPLFEDSLPVAAVEAGRYVMRFARSQNDLDAVQRLRFDVFNLELGEGLDESFVTGRDRDPLDACFHHLIIATANSGRVVGTYRMQTSEMARRYTGFYSAGEFDLSTLPDEILDGAVEVGRACVERQHRNGRVLHLLWRGLARYLEWNRKRYLFGCCSLPTLDEGLALRAHAWLERENRVHKSVHVSPLCETRCVQPDGGGVFAPEQVTMPPLFASYLRLGAQVCGPPARDVAFKTTDFFVLLDIEALDAHTHRTFFGGDRCPSHAHGSGHAAGT